jgi:hypothetical protein
MNNEIIILILCQLGIFLGGCSIGSYFTEKRLSKIFMEVVEDMAKLTAKIIVGKVEVKEIKNDKKK